MSDLVDLGGCEADCGEDHPLAEVIRRGNYYEVCVGNHQICRFDLQSDDYAYSNARACADRWNAHNGVGE